MSQWAPVAADYNCRLPADTSSTRVFLLAESDARPSALWLQAEFEGARAHDWLAVLGNSLDLAAVSSLDIACADWSLLPALVARMPALASLCVTALPDHEHTHGALLPELDAALLAPGAAPGLLALRPAAGAGLVVEVHALFRLGVLAVFALSLLFLTKQFHLGPVLGQLGLLLRPLLSVIT